MRRSLLFTDRLAAACAVVGLTAAFALATLPGARGQDEKPADKADEKKADDKADEKAAPKAEAEAPAPKADRLPASDIFVKPPQTAPEYWEAVDFLIRTGDVPLAVPYLKGFLKSNPDDEALVAIRDRYGIRTVLQLDRYPETRPYAARVTEMLNAAVRRQATRADRIERFIAALTRSKEEQTYGVQRLREAGPFAVPYLVRALQAPGQSADDRAKVVDGMGRLDPASVPAWIAALDSPDAALVGDVINALGRIGDTRAVPQLSFLASDRNAKSSVQGPARRAIAMLTGRSYESQTLSPVRLLTAEARRYHLHQVRFPGAPVLVWEWDPGRQLPAPREVSPSEAEGLIGMRDAREALLLDPADRPAQVVLVSLALEKAVERVGFAGFPVNDPSGAYVAALAAGAPVLADVLRTAIADGKPDLAAAAATALGQVADSSVPAFGRGPNPLVMALSAPNRRVQFAAARALVLLNPSRPFAGSSRVVPVLAWFATNQASPRAVVIDGNQTRGSQLAGYLKAIGYEPDAVATGPDGFRAAADRADVELILIDHHMIQGPWRLIDTLTNLRADARTAGVPVYVVGPLNLDVNLNYLKTEYPGVKLVVQPTSAAVLERQLGGRPESLSAAERAGYARDAASLLGRIAGEPNSPFAADLARVGPALTTALNTPPTSLAAASALGDVPDAGAQRGLADAALDPGRPPALRVNSAFQLARSVQRFGPLVAADQEAKILAAHDQERDPAVRAGLAAVVGALRPKAAPAGVRLRQFQPPGPSPAQATPPPPPPAPGPEAEPPAAEIPSPAPAAGEKP